MHGVCIYGQDPFSRDVRIKWEKNMNKNNVSITYFYYEMRDEYVSERYYDFLQKVIITLITGD